MSHSDGSRAAKPEPEDPGLIDPVDRTQLAWNRTAIAFAAIGAAMLKSSPIAGVIVLVLTVPVWVAVRATGAIATAARLRLVTVTVLLVATAALVVAVIGHGPDTLSELLHGR